MVKWIALWLVILAGCAIAQVGTPQSVTSLNTEANTQFPDNNTGAITPFIFRQMMLNMIASSGNLNTPDLTLNGGANVVSFNIGTVSSGTSTVDCGKNPLQYMTNGGAFTLAAPVNDGSCIVLITNNGSAGTISFSGFTEGSNTGDALDTTNAHIFAVSVFRINSISHYLVSAYQ